MKVSTSLRIAAVLGVVAFASNAQAQSCSADNTTTSAGLALAASASAPNCQVSTTASATVNHVLRLTLGSTTTALGTIAQAQFDQSDTAATSANNSGFPFTLGPTLQAKGNRPFIVKIHGENPLDQTGTFSYVHDNDASTYDAANNWSVTKNVGDLKYLIANSGVVAAQTSGFADMPVAGSAATVITAASGGLINKQVQYRTKWDYANDRPGSYSVAVVYTIIGN